MDEKVLADSFIEIVSKTSGMSLKLLAGEADGSLFDITGVMNLNGESGGTILVSASMADMRTVCSQMMGIPEGSVQHEDITDAVCELVNMTAGSAKLRIGDSSRSFKLSMPFAFEGGDMRLTTKKRTNVVSMLLGNEEVTFKVKIVMN